MFGGKDSFRSLHHRADASVVADAAQPSTARPNRTLNVSLPAARVRLADAAAQILREILLQTMPGEDETTPRVVDTESYDVSDEPGEERWAC